MYSENRYTKHLHIYAAGPNYQLNRYNFCTAIKIGCKCLLVTTDGFGRCGLVYTTFKLFRPC
jgi:hypothetical protein